MRRSLLWLALLLPACQSEAPAPAPAELPPDSLYIGYAHAGSDDLMLSAWQAGVSGTEATAPRLLALVGPDETDLVPIQPGEAAADADRLKRRRGQRLTGRNVLNLIVSQGLNCGRVGAASFIEARLQDAPVVAVAGMPSRNPDRGRMLLRRRPGLAEESVEAMQQRRFVVWEHGAFYRASASQWMDAAGLSEARPTLAERPDGESLAEHFDKQSADYAFVVAGRKGDTDDARYGTVVDLKPEAFADPQLLQSLLVCRTDSVTTHRSDLLALMKRWQSTHAQSAPTPVDTAKLDALMALLATTNIISGTVPTTDWVDELAGGTP